MSDISLRRAFCCPLVGVRSFRVLAVMATALLPLVGCTDVSHGDRVPLTGTVTKGGEPLKENATIYFEPIDGQAGLGSSGQVTQGKFTIPEESGPTPGKTYKVTVTTAPGIPSEDTPRDQIKLPQTFETTIEVPPRGEKSEELVINFE